MPAPQPTKKARRGNNLENFKLWYEALPGDYLLQRKRKGKRDKTKNSV